MIHRLKWIATAALMLLSSLASAEFKAGVHYTVLAEPVAVVADGKIHVEEAFWYGCPHCFSLEDYVRPWKAKMPDDVKFTGLPAMFGRAWVVHAQLYHVADVLGVLDQVHYDIFRAVNVEGPRLLSRKEQREFLMSRANVNEADFEKAYDSFAVKSRMQQVDQRIRAYQIDGVPAMIVQGKYVVNARMAGGQHRVMDVVDHLIGLERSTAR
ncbi:MAG: thiol:disulfide interchange protein DsbA/DsbL [Bacterioplanes sp.]|nr:thiol:disulfide interchange protein DsbA/DsbL [Bacterioplanes sp.]